MSSSSSPPSSHHDHHRTRRKDRPPALDPAATLLGAGARTDRDAATAPPHQPTLHVFGVDDHDSDTPDADLPRSASATSSLDPYYFGVSTPSESPVLAPAMPRFLPKTPETTTYVEPVTPGKDPASIDRRGLVGVGELATPRWARGERRAQVDIDEQLDENDEDEFIVSIHDAVIVSQPAPADPEDDPPDSPWTIEAIDGENEDTDEFLDVEPPPRSLRTKHSIADESGGEEILYPRQTVRSQEDVPPLPSEPPPMSTIADMNEPDPGHPPSAFMTPVHRARKRTSDEFELDYTNGIVSKQASNASLRDKDKTTARRHRSLGSGGGSSSTSTSASTPAARDKLKDRRRETLSLNVKSPQGSAASSSSSSHGEPHHARRLMGPDYTHLPPSPGSSSIQQFLRNTSTGSAAGSPLHTSPPATAGGQQPQSHLAMNVAHSLLRGTQEGWSDLDDRATVEALRKIDGIAGRGARARTSVGGHSRVGSISAGASRPGTPSKAGAQGQWEGVESRRASRMIAPQSIQAATGKEKERERDRDRERDSLRERRRQSVGAAGLGLLGMPEDMGEVKEKEERDRGEGFLLKEDSVRGSPVQEKAKKHTSAGQRASFTPKRGSASSTTYTSTPTTSSRDSASLSTGTSLTSVSAASGRQSNTKARRNSGGSEISNHSLDAASVRDRAAAHVGEVLEEEVVPPVPPLPKDFSSFKHAQPNAGIAFPSSDSGEDRMPKRSLGGESTRTAVPETPSQAQPVAVPTTPGRNSLKATATTPQKTPSKKWSFSMPLGKKLMNSPSQSSMRDAPAPRSPGLALSPRALSFSHRAAHKDQLSPAAARAPSDERWTAVNTGAMASASSLASVSSMSSVHPVSPPASAPPPMSLSKSPEGALSRPPTSSSSSTNLTASVPPVPQQMPLSPTSSVRRGPSTKRLTPSSIPFFRRSSSQSMQQGAPSASPTYASQQQHGFLRPPSGPSPTKDVVTPVSQHASSSSHRKSLGAGLSSLLKGSSSRRSLHSDKEKSEKSGKEDNAEKDRSHHKKEEKDRSESRISSLIGRKRGKTVSSAHPKKVEPVAMPPMKIAALPPSTAQRVASLNSGSTSSLSSTNSTPKASRVTSQTLSSMQKQADISARNSRNVLPTIAGSPSVGSLAHHSFKEPPQPSSLVAGSMFPKETPTKIPRISSRSSTNNSPTLKGTGAGRRSSIVVGSSSVAQSRGTSPAVNGNETTEFGVLENGQIPKGVTGQAGQRLSVRASPSTNTAARVTRQATAPSATVNGAASRKNRDSISFGGLRKASTGSVASISAVAQSQQQQEEASTSTSHHRLSALSPAKGFNKLLPPKISLSQARSTQPASTPSRNTNSTPSPVFAPDDDEVIGDEEMRRFIKKQHTKKLATGATQEELDNMIRFPEPQTPTPPAAPAAILKSAQVQYLSEYERKEILEYPSVYYIGAGSEKKPATLENSTNNHSYDDDRGDYQVVIHDHLAYRYEIIDTLGKGSFGQVLHCRDHCTGESVAIKIIRNKKRFHHQALVEIKILDNLRKWDQEEKYHVIKMTEHFYFRGHLCIATELLSINLYELIKANGFVGFSTVLIRRFTSQMLQSLVLMRHHRIVHCDLKPENVLLRHPAKSAIKVIDFGSSCFEHEKIYTYIQSRFYRSPEVILGMSYHMAIDMWSLGCIMAELYTGFPIFPGENEQEQLSCIMEVLGVPDKEFINRSSRKRLFFDQTGAPRPCVNSKGRRRRAGSKTLAQVLRTEDADFVDFIAKCLVWDPERRIKPSAALRHPYIAGAKNRAKVTSPSPSASKTLMSSSSAGSSNNRHSKSIPETPKKSLISAPTPLTARTSRVTSGVPSTPSTSSNIHASLGSSSRSLRANQTQSLSYHSSHSSRTMLAK